MHLSFAAEDQIQKLVASKSVRDEKVSQMRKDAVSFIITICDKVTNRTPTGSIIVRNADAFDPKIMMQAESDVFRKK